MRVDPEEKAELKRVIKKLGFARITDFFRHAMETLHKQISLGEDLEWPLRFEKKPDRKTRSDKRQRSHVRVVIVFDSTRRRGAD